jgi:hypothetical protein
MEKQLDHPIVTVPFANDWSQRPNEAFLHAQQQADGQTQLWITGIRLDNYESVVGPERARLHRESFSAYPVQHRGGSLGRIIRNLIQR